VFFFILNVTFISFIQSVLLFLIAAPTYAILLASQHEQEITLADMGFTALQLALVASEFISDQQQWGKLEWIQAVAITYRANYFVDFQNAKTKYRKTAKLPPGFKQDDLDRGFITSGLWAYCRHPNFSAEQTIWIVLYQWSCYATNALYSWTGLGSLFLVMLFQGSTWLTELITAGKYPEYKHYQRQVGMQIPSLTPYKSPEPKVIRTSELAKKMKSKQT
jgi:steroid 5-alpha reductase family enzyme